MLRGLCKMQNDDRIVMYSVKDLRDIFGFSLTQAYSLVNAHGFSSIKIGGRILVEKRALEKWLQKNEGKKILLG